jgi:hypothetical protein
MGIQELLLHFHPLVGAIVLPGMALAALALLPFYDVTAESVGVYFRSLRGRYLTLLAVSLALVFTPAWIVLDEFVLVWTEWLPTWPTLISDGLVPAALIFLGLAALDEFIQRAFKANREERILFFFTFFLIALLVLTGTGVFFRGPGMELFWPWNMPAHP